MSSNHRPSYVALVAALREEFNDLQLESLWIQVRGNRYDVSSLGVLAQAVHDAHDPVYDTSPTSVEQSHSAQPEGEGDPAATVRVALPQAAPARRRRGGDPQ